MLHTTLITFITSLKKFNMLSKKCWSSSDISYVCKFVTKQFLRDHATYHRHKRCQYGNVLRSTDKINVYLVLMILVFGYYETIFWKKRATYGRNINANDRKINLQAEIIFGIDTWEIVFDYYETIIRENMQHIIKYKCIWHMITSSNRDNTRSKIYFSGICIYILTIGFVLYRIIVS